MVIPWANKRDAHVIARLVMCGVVISSSDTSRTMSGNCCLCGPEAAFRPIRSPI